MNFSGTMSFIRQAQRKQTSESDIPDKFKVIDILRKHHVYGLTGEVLYFDRETGKRIFVPTDQQNLIIHKPDVFIKPDYVIEIDGWGTHGGNDELTRTVKTRERNTHYLSACLKLTIIDKETLRVLDVNWHDYLKQDLRSYGLIA